MQRWIVRICSFAFAIVLGICSIQTVQGIQKLAPFGSTVTFNINIMAAAQTKDTLAQGMAAIGDNQGTTIGKVSPNKEKYKTDRDVVLFSGGLGSATGPVVEQDKVLWLNQGITGQVINYKKMGDRTFNGEYFAIDTPGLREAIQTWAKANAISVDWKDLSYLTSEQSIITGMVSSSAGLMIPACLLLTLAAVAISLQKRWRQQKVELTEGKPYWKVRLESIGANLSLLLQGFFFGILASVLYLLSFPEGTAQVRAVASACAGAVFVFLLIAFLLVCLLSFFSVPPFKALGIRDNTSKALKTFALIVEFSGTTVVIVAIAAALSAVNLQSNVLGQVETFNQIPDATRLSLLYTPPGTQESKEAEKGKLTDLMQQAETADVLVMSLDVNQSISLSGDELAGFDHFLIANKTYLDAIGVGIESDGPRGSLHEIPATEVPKFATMQTAIWLAKDNKQTPPFYRYEGPGLLSLGPNAAEGGKSVVSKNPLVLVVDAPTTAWDYDAFLLPLLSSGNLFFSDYQSARELVDASGASDLVASIDNMAELNMQAAQDISMLIQVLSFSIAVALVIVIVMSFQAATSWRVASSKLIFAQRCAGRSLADIATGRIAGKVATSAAAALAGFCIEFFIITNSLLSSLGVSLAVFVLTVLCQIAFRCYLASSAFHKTAIRR